MHALCILELRLNHKIIFQNFTSNETPSHPHTCICIFLYFSGEDSSWIIISSHFIISKFKNSQASSHPRNFCIISKRSCPFLKIWFQPICLHPFSTVAFPGGDNSNNSNTCSFPFIPLMFTGTIVIGKLRDQKS